MVKVEDVCDWFKDLAAHKRIDILCGLLHLCHPLELRFTGTVIEDLAKKDFHYLRDQEIKANQRSDLAINNKSLNDEKLRAKMITALALINSTNTPCAEVIYNMLQHQLDNFSADNCLNTDQLVLILTMAVHHPAFTFYQKNRLGQVLERLEGRLRELFEDNCDDRDSSIQALPPETIIQPNSQYLLPADTISEPNSQYPLPQAEKATVVDIRVVNAVPSQNKKGGAQYRIHTTWSNKEVREVLLKFKQLQDLHHKLLNKFPDERKTHVSVPVFPGTYAHNKEECLEDKINSLNTYFRKLAKAPTHILDCDIFTEPLRNGTLVYQPKSTSSTLPSTTTSSSQTQDHLSPLTEDGKYRCSQYGQSLLMSYSSMVPLCSPGTSQMSSAANSPASSRNSSPVPLISRSICKNNYVPSEKVNNISTIGTPQQPVASCDDICQILQGLNMDDYYDNLKDYPVHQIVYMSKEELAKAGLPPEAQAKLKSMLEQVKPVSLNGIIDSSSRFPTAETSPTFFPPFCFHPSFTLFAPSYQQHFIHPSYAAAAQSGHLSMLSSPHAHIQAHPQAYAQAHENSPANSEASSPTRSPPLQQSLLNEHTQEHSQVPDSSFHLLLTSSGTANVSQGNICRNTKVEHLDSSGSEEDKTTGYGMEQETVNNKGRTRPQQSQSLPLINQRSLSVSAMEAVKAMPMSAAHHQAARSSNTPPLQSVSTISQTCANPIAAVVNGYISEPARNQPHGTVVARSVLKSGHTSPQVHKNVAPDTSQTLTNLGKNAASSNNLPFLHANLPPQPFSIGPSAAATHLMGLSPVNFPTNNTFQPSPTQPTVIAEGNSVYPMLMYAHPRGILTTMANSTAIMTSSQSHHTGSPMSHSPSPADVVATNTTCTDHLQPSTFIAQVVDPNRCSHSPPVQTASHIAAAKSQTNTGGTNSSSPSPPAASKQVGTNDTQASGRGHQVFAFQNGYLSPIIYHHPAHFPNGLAPEFGSWLRIPQVTSSHYPYMYGSVFPHQNLSGTMHTTPVNNNPATATVNGKSKCYNCGLTGHKPSECNEVRMENMSNTFHLSYKPSDSPA